ncbi:MAG TPA: VOC family protein, partial [Lapillicoccus sp.]|nr:VOC family protein [Lapillicoccus sp.]
MLNRASVTANIPAADLDRARSFYADTLGMTPSSEMADAGMLIYRTDGGTTFQVYQTEFAGQAGHTIAQFHVDDVE